MLRFCIICLLGSYGQFIGSVATLMEIPVTCALVFLLVFGGPAVWTAARKPLMQTPPRVMQVRKGRLEQQRISRAAVPTLYRTSTEVNGGALREHEMARVNRSETASLRALLDRQQEQLDTMRGQLEQEGALANEMRVLRRESVNMNARITQLYAQLLNEIIQKKDQALEQRRLESLVLNTTAQVAQSVPTVKKHHYYLSCFS